MSIESHRVPAALRESEEHYRAVAEAATDAIITIDADSTILIVNPAAERLLKRGWILPCLCASPRSTLVNIEMIAPGESHARGTFVVTFKTTSSYRSADYNRASCVTGYYESEHTAAHFCQSKYYCQLYAKHPSVTLGPRRESSCCKLAVIFLALNAAECVPFCSNDCFSAEYAVCSLEGIVCSGCCRIHNPKVGRLLRD